MLVKLICDFKLDVYVDVRVCGGCLSFCVSPVIVCAVLSSSHLSACVSSAKIQPPGDHRLLTREILFPKESLLIPASLDLA